MSDEVTTTLPASLSAGGSLAEIDKSQPIKTPCEMHPLKTLSVRRIIIGGRVFVKE